jgi:hypothetical protein
MVRRGRCRAKGGLIQNCFNSGGKRCSGKAQHSCGRSMMLSPRALRLAAPASEPPAMNGRRPRSRASLAILAAMRGFTAAAHTPSPPGSARDGARCRDRPRRRRQWPAQAARRRDARLDYRGDLPASTGISTRTSVSVMSVVTVGMTIVCGKGRDQSGHSCMVVSPVRTVRMCYSSGLAWTAPCTARQDGQAGELRPGVQRSCCFDSLVLFPARPSMKSMTTRDDIFTVAAVRIGQFKGSGSTKRLSGPACLPAPWPP